MSVVWPAELEKEVRRVVREELKALDRQIRARFGNRGRVSVKDTANSSPTKVQP